MLKRILDLVGSFVGIFIFLPFFPIIALAIYLEDKGPVIVKLERISQGNVIKVYKFRSMVAGASRMKSDLHHLNERNDGPFFKIKDDPRLTKVGRFLRKIRVDEVPQLFNVIKGDLSLVGPRPHERIEIDQHPQKYKVIPMFKAGVTGLSQVSGASGLPYLKELELDLYYIENQSIWLDMKILLKTVWIFFSDPTGV